MKTKEKTYLQSTKYRCPICHQLVPPSDYLFSHKRLANGSRTIVEHCRKCRDLGF